MAVASWMLRSRSGLNSRRYERNRKEIEDVVILDLFKDPKDNCFEILEAICKNGDISEGKRLNYLNNFVKLIMHVKGNLDRTGFTLEEVLSCLRVAMLQQSTQVRAACLRAVRHLLGSSEDIIVLNALQFPQLVARSLDVVLRNELERIQALKLIRKVLLLNPEQFDMALARSLVSLANGVTEEKERMLRACLAALCELAVLNADLFMRCGGVTAITRNILDCQMPRIVECLCGVLLHLLHTPATRMRAHVDLQCLAAPYCDFHYRHAWMDKSRDERELRFNCSRLALLSVLRSWPGLLHFCTRGGGLQAIVQVLYLNQLEVRKAVLDLLYELLGLPQPDWTDEYAVALNAVDPSDPQDCWRLGEGFIVAEARAIMPHLARCTPNIADIHLAVLLYVFLEVGLLGALVEVIVSSDTFISVRATVLLGELLHLMHVLLPPECCDVSPALPGLLARAPHHQGHHQALAAVTALNQLHALLKRRPASSSLFLDHILRAGRRLSCTGTGERIAGAQRSRRHRSPTIAEATDEWRPVAPVSTKTGAGARIYRLVRHGSASSSAQAMVSDSAQSISPPDMNPGGEVALLRESGVLQNKEGFHAWNWNVIGAILRRNGDLALRLDDSNHRLFLRRLVHYYQPSSNRYSHLDLPSPQDRQSHVYTAVGCELVRRLLAMSDQPESTKLLLEWFTDILNHIDAISTSKSAHDCLFSPQHMATTLCQTYFLFIGHVCHTLRGINLLKDIGLFTKLAALATTTNHSCYVKLIVSSFDYATDGPHRGILAKILTCRQESSRLYATQFLLVLLRAGLPSFERWGVEMLVKQLFDQSKAVSLAALNIAHEACERRSCLERLVELRPDLQHLGDKGLLLLARLMSLPRGFRVLGGSRFATAEIVRWADSFVYRYVSLLEAELLDALTLHQRSEDGRYDRRHSSAGRWAGARRDVFIPPHLFGQLAQHEQGWSALLDSGRLIPFITLVLEAARKRNIADWYNVTDKDILELKAAMWACGHVATSTHGTQKLIDDGFFKAVIDLAESCAVYSIRGTAVYVLGLMATTYRAANELFSLGWACVRHDRHDRWPVVEEEDWSTCTQPPPLAPRSDSEEDGGTTISSSDNVPAWAAETWVDEVDELGTPALRQPTIINELAVQHKRSLSESHRNRDNSCTESTTSGVSSSDSAAGPIPIKDKPQIQNNNTINNGVNCRLSPIPSSSSLSTLKTGLEMMRHWTADGPRRVSLSAHSCSNSTSLTVSPPDVNGSRLSHQDLLGYSTLRTLRRVRASSFRSDSFNRQLNSSSGGFDDGSVENAVFGGPSSSLFTGGHERLPIRDPSVDVGQCYMGICLPRQLVRLFPEDDMYYPVNGSLKITTDPGRTDSEGDVSEESGQKRRNSRHETRTCLLCSGRAKSPGSPEQNQSSTPEPSQQDYIKPKAEILKHIERLSNPVWSKQSKQALLHMKQRNPSAFQDVCLFSQMSSTIASTGYRLSSRRFLQELFLDLNFSELLNEQHHALIDRLFVIKENIAKRSTVIISATDTNRNITKGFELQQTDIPHKTLSSVNKIGDLKLTCSENKFPITQRNISKDVIERNYAVLRSRTSPEPFIIMCQSHRPANSTVLHSPDT